MVCNPHVSKSMTVLHWCFNTDVMPAENIPILEALEECLSLRDKYMSISGQKLGFNPRDHDGTFGGLDDDIAGVCGVRPDADYPTRPNPKSPFRQWRIYPRPPPPHWHWKGKGTVVPSNEIYRATEDEEFDLAKCDIPGADKSDFAIDEKGVFQVYNSTGGRSYLSYLPASLCVAAFCAAARCTSKRQDTMPRFDHESSKYTSP